MVRDDQGMPEISRSASDSTTDLLEHIDDWMEYLSVLCKQTTDTGTRRKYERQLKYLVRFRCGANCNIAHNLLLKHYYETASPEPRWRAANAAEHPANGKRRNGDNELRRALPPSMGIEGAQPIQQCYLGDTNAYLQVAKALASEELFFLQGPPGTGKTTAIVEIVLQTLHHLPNARILITSETHTAVDNALDRLTQLLDSSLLNEVLRYPRFGATQLENAAAQSSAAHERANALWRQAHASAPELTEFLWQNLQRNEPNEEGRETLPRWMVRQLADKHRIIGVTCNQIDHLLDANSEPFDLVVVDECSKATLPEWLMAVSVARKCVLVGDHRQLPPTFCEEESDVLDELDEHQATLIRDGVIERLFENLPAERKGMLQRQYRMLPHIGEVVSELFYGGKLQHDRRDAESAFKDFGWLTYEMPGLKVPAQSFGERKVLVNAMEIELIIERLQLIHQTLVEAAEVASVQRLTVAVITPYRAQCRELRKAIEQINFDGRLAIEVDTVDAFQGRQADVVFFSFVRTCGPATFFADDRRLNVALSRARDCVYLVGDLRYLRSRGISAVNRLVRLPIRVKAKPGSGRPPIGERSVARPNRPIQRME
ncbi:DEAD/DEAH box helicase [Paraburkholderia caribensis]|uniref:DEAD/DEAH box helicase n=1 Tax=Paraburkholderia caribensis TaxID=75105 RepID=UPI001CB43427|nr:AAA domain-containing protein [Paraburkholderia caribensis]CAG9269769.1 DNA helicase [Paraburkholderia caribensis]